MTKRSKRAEAGVIQNGPGGSQEYPKHSKQNAVIRSAAALRAPLTSLQNVKKNPRTLPKICQKVINKYTNGRKKPQKSPPGVKQTGSETKHKNFTFFVVPLMQKCFILASILPKVSQRCPRGSQKVPKRIRKAIKKHPRKHSQNAPQTETRNWDPYFLQIFLKHDACHTFRASER